MKAASTLIRLHPGTLLVVVTIFGVCLPRSAVATASAPRTSGPDAAAVCPVTIATNPRHRYGNDALSTTLWSLGVVLFTSDGPGTIYEDGSLGMKWHWAQHIEGQLSIDGRRLDASSPPLRAIVEDSGRLPPTRSKTGFRATGLIFSTSGCWEVTGRVAEQSLTFVTLVIDVCKYGTSLCK
jgi:hypothetical protein